MALPAKRSPINTMYGVRFDTTNASPANLSQLQTCLQQFKSVLGTALLSGQLDAAYVGPNPAINAWQKSGGTAIRIVSGAATGGASIVVKAGITSAAQLKGQSVATPSLGNTQDVAIRYWLKQHGLATSTTGGGDVSVKPTTPNSAAVLEYQSGQIAGARFCPV